MQHLFARATLPILSCAALLGLGACSMDELPAAMAGEDDVPAYGPAGYAGPAPLRSVDFNAAIDRAFLRATDANLSDDEFARKWAGSLASPLLFLRSYPGAFHRDLARVAADRFPGPQGLCFGDPHPDNFGYLRPADKTRYAFNDLDDSGPCPLAADAARYFTALRLAVEDRALIAAALEQYVDVVKDPGRAVDVPGSLAPDWDEVRSKGLDESVTGDRFDRAKNPALSAPTASERAAVLATSQSDPILSRFSVYDVAVLDRTVGGSGGLHRYWLLAQTRGVRTILELKQAATPGVEWGRHTETLPPDRRLAVLTAAFWGTTPAADNFYVRLGGARYLCRDRLLRKSLSPLDLGSKDQRRVLLAQASHMALLHGDAWKGTKKDDLRVWLSGTSQTLADRWRAALPAAPR